VIYSLHSHVSNDDYKPFNSQSGSNPVRWPRHALPGVFTAQYGTDQGRQSCQPDLQFAPSLRATHYPIKGAEGSPTPLPRLAASPLRPATPYRSRRHLTGQPRLPDWRPAPCARRHITNSPHCRRRFRHLYGSLGAPNRVAGSGRRRRIMPPRRAVRTSECSQAVADGVSGVSPSAGQFTRAVRCPRLADLSVHYSAGCRQSPLGNGGCDRAAPPRMYSALSWPRMLGEVSYVC